MDHDPRPLVTKAHDRAVRNTMQLIVDAAALTAQIAAMNGITYIRRPSRHIERNLLKPLAQISECIHEATQALQRATEHLETIRESYSHDQNQTQTPHTRPQDQTPDHEDLDT